MTDTRHVSPEDLALHAMLLLSEDEAAEVRAHLAECGVCRAELAAAQQDLTLLAMTVDLETPSPAARERFLQQIASEKISSPEAPTAEVHDNVIPFAASRERGKLLPWLGWAVAAGATFVAFSLHRERGELQAFVALQSDQMRTQTAQVATLSADAVKARTIMDALTDSTAMRVTLNTTPAAKALPQGRAIYLADKGTLLFTANNLTPLPSAKVYELWLIPANGTAPLAAGTFHPDARGYASVIMPALPLGIQAKAFGVTIEADGGSTTPTLPIVLVGG